MQERILVVCILDHRVPLPLIFSELTGVADVSSAGCIAVRAAGLRAENNRLVGDGCRVGDGLPRVIEPRPLWLGARSVVALTVLTFSPGSANVSTSPCVGCCGSVLVSSDGVLVPQAQRKMTRSNDAMLRINLNLFMASGIL